MGENIFINYRRSEDRSAAGRLYDQLEAVFGREHVFIDVDGILPGKDFVDVLTERVSECDIFLSIIGQRWSEVADAKGARRLDDPNDYVRIEIESALKLGKHVIPILVEDARMPGAQQLPASLAPFARRNAIRLSHERFKLEVGALVHSIAALRGEKPGTTPPAAARPDTSRPARQDSTAPRRPSVLIATLAGIGAIAASGIIAVVMMRSPTADNPPRQEVAGPQIARPERRPAPAAARPDIGASSPQAPLRTAEAQPQASPPATPAPPTKDVAQPTPAPSPPAQTVPQQQAIAATTLPAIATAPSAVQQGPRRVTVAARETLSACGQSGIVATVSGANANVIVLTRPWLLPSEGQIRTLRIGETLSLSDACRLRLAEIKPGDWPLFHFEEIR